MPANVIPEADLTELPLIDASAGIPGEAVIKDGRSAPRWLNAGRVPCLDGMRAIAILLVIFSHLGSQIPNFPLRRYLLDGHLGVECFFVISGFLITLLLLREHERSGTISIKGFYTRRALRILPASTAYLAVIFALSLFVDTQLNGRVWAAALTYTMCYVPKLSDGWLLGHLWSLSVEEHFYLVWPFLFFWLRPRKAMYAALGYVLVTPLLRYVVWQRFSHWMDIDFCSVTQMSSIAMGCLLAFVVKGYQGAAVQTFLRTRALAVLSAGILLLLLSGFCRHSGKYEIMLGDPVNAASFALILAGLLYSENSIVSRVLNAKALVWIGVLSYSLYLWQQPFTWLPAVRFGWFANVMFLALAASLSYFCVERPFLRWKERRKAGL